MTVLYKKKSPSNIIEWSTGSTSLLSDIEINGNPLTICIKCSFGNSEDEHYALFDTGARWTVIPQSIAEIYQDSFFPTGIPETITTRLGRYTGELHSCELNILVDDGTDLRLSPNVLVLPDWRGPIVLGFNTLLANIRWACDPVINQAGRLYFGIDDLLE